MMNKYILLLSILLTNTYTLAEQSSELPLRLFFNLNNQNTVILLDKKSNKHLNTFEYLTHYNFIKVKDGWRATLQTKDGKFGYLNQHGKWAIKPTLDQAKAFSKDDIARVQLDNKWGFINSDGSYLIKPQYFHVTPFTKGLAAIKENKNDDYYFINKEGKKAFDATFSNAKPFTDNGTAAIASSQPIPVFEVTVDKVVKTQIKGNELWGFIDTTGKIIIQPQFKHASGFTQFGVANVSDNTGDYIIINNQGKPINNTHYKYLWAYSKSGVAWSESSEKDNFIGYIDSKGKQVWKASYHDFSGEHNGLLVNNRNGFQVFDPFGKLVIKEKSTWLSSFSDANVSVALRQGNWGILSRKGIFTPLPDNIIAPLTNSHNSVFGFKSGLIAMINDKREITYFDRDATMQYRFIANAKGLMTLYDKNKKEIWQSTIKNTKAYPFLFRGIEEHFKDSRDYGEGIYAVIENFLKSEPRKYFIPNPLYGEGEDPYNLSADIDKLKKGLIKIVAKGYVGENEWGSYYFLSDIEMKQFSKYKEHLITLITQKYGEPSYNKSYLSRWEIGDKILKLELHSDSGDGDFYNQLTLELNQKGDD